jgi:hypothetical protein
MRISRVLLTRVEPVEAGRGNTEETEAAERGNNGREQ